jgi:hypothetical protein
MSLTPINLPRVFDSLPAQEKKIISYGLSHLVLLVACFVALLGCVYLYDSKRAELADTRATAAEAKAQVADQQNAGVQVQTQRQMAALAQQNQFLQNQIAALASAIAQRDAALAGQRQEIAGLAPPALAQEWGAAAQETAPPVDSQGHFLASLPLAQKSLSALISVATLQADNRDLTKQATELKQIISNDAGLLANERAAHQSDVAACTADKAALQAEVKKVKADARRSKIKWCLGGFAAGLISGLNKFFELPKW